MMSIVMSGSSLIHFFSVSGNIRRPSQLDYGMADSFPGFNGSSLTLSQFISHYRIYEPQIPECCRNTKKKGSDSSFLSEDLSLKIAYMLCEGLTELKKSDDHSMTTIIGTHNFVAPEILAYNKPNDRMDIYSIGYLIHYICLGYAPGEVARMTVYETIMVVLGVIGALISLSKLVIALLNFLDKRNSKRK